MLRLEYTFDAAIVTIALRSKACREVTVPATTGTASDAAITKIEEKVLYMINLPTKTTSDNHIILSSYFIIIIMIIITI